MNAVVASLIMVGVLAIGEMVSFKTRAKLPSLLVASVLFYLLVQSGVVPSNIIESSTLTAIGTVMIPVLLVHLGTTVPLEGLKQQYKAVLISLAGLLFSVLLILFVIPIFFDFESALAGAGPLTGGLIAYLVTSDALKEMGFENLVTIAICVYILQKIMGMPVTSFLLRKYAYHFKESGAAERHMAASVAADASYEDEEVEATEQESEKRYLLPKHYLDSPFILLFMILIAGTIAYGLGEVTGVHQSIYGLILGIAGSYFGIFPPKALEKANAFGLAMVSLLLIVLSSLADVTPAQIWDVLPVIVSIIAIGTAGLVVGGFIASKLLKWHPYKGISVALTALYGFPADYLLAQEVSRSVGETEEEQNAIFDDILSPMLIGGFVSVSSASIIIASILVKLL
ncbi:MULTISPECIES: hypothetical protein [Pontibacillus]|uniref:Uncharacterized protein n=1 Tax=Pontibacillus chungwhensis TaxID=265426 RepID=A0ABY8V679_9BACI|nr:MULTISPECIES: hypothetical protein [Pontibacillus]MCD5324345.1 hypothetical protein [Pontibacillus sp. HN14]WIF99356.1 hypothetical protein QNI29_06780 [Pontibacillus chungwhensis]